MHAYIHYNLVAFLLASARHIKPTALDDLLSFLDGLEELHPIHAGAKLFPMELISYEDLILTQRLHVRNGEYSFFLVIEDGLWSFEPEVCS